MGNCQLQQNQPRDAFPQTIQSNPADAFVNIALTDPHRYFPESYELYRKEMMWWREIHGSIGDQQLIGILPLKADGLEKKNTRESHGEL